MIKTAHRHRHQHSDLTSQREVDLAYGLKDKQASKLFIHVFYWLIPFFNVIAFFYILKYIFSTNPCTAFNIYLQCISFHLLSMLQLKHHKGMWCNGRKFRIKS